MKEREVQENELAAVAGGGDGRSFAQLTEDFARENRCANCPHKMIYRQHEMCVEVYVQLLQSYTRGRDVDMRCTRRGGGTAAV